MEILNPEYGIKGDEIVESNIVEKSDQKSIEMTVWLADLTYTQQQVSAELIPQAIGGIATYVESCYHFSKPIRLFKYPEALAEALERDGCPDIIGFSNYVWNSKLSKTFARRIHEISPHTVIIFGGPHYPHERGEQITYLQANPEINFYIEKEGERAVAELIYALSNSYGDLNKVKALDLASVHSIDDDGVEHLGVLADRIKDLSEIPSPYTSGRLDEFFDGKLLPIIQTNRGCPFTCTFCVEGVGYYNKINKNPIAKVAAEIDYIGRKMKIMREDGGRNDLFIADSNFGMYKNDVQTCREIAKAQDDYGWPEYINVATGKNQKERVLESAKLVRGALRLSGSVQSLDEGVLANVKRNNISSNDLMMLALEAADIDANSYSEVILGLPGDSKIAHYKTLKAIIDAGFIKVIPYTLMTLPGSEMCTPESKTKYEMDLRFRVLPRCFGYFNICGKQVLSVEIEEVCVATNTLPYDDYIECRKMHLMISIFYNDGVFGGLLKFFRDQKISAYEWLEVLHKSEVSGSLGDMIQEFEQATRDELWQDLAEFEAFLDDAQIIKKYIAGDLGLNLLFTYKSISSTRFGRELLSLALLAAKQVLASNSLDSRKNMAFIRDILEFDLCRMTNIFEDNEIDVSANFSFDVARFMRSSEPVPLDGLILDEKISIDFTITDDQREVIQRGLKLFGSDNAGIGRILSKFHISRLLRNPASTIDRFDEPSIGFSADTGHNVSSQINLHDS